MKIALFVLLCIMGHVLVWFSHSLQLISEWWSDKQFLSALLFSLPIALMFVYATKYGYEYFGSLWSVRFSGFAVSYLVFPVLTYIYLKESFMTPRVILTTLLCVFIIAIQFIWD